MIKNPWDVLTQYPVRKTKLQKQAFRNAVQSYAEELGYSVSVEKDRFGVQNVVIGDPEQAKYLVTAHYDTCARMLIPNLITPCVFLSYFLYQMLLVALIVAEAIVFGILGWILFAGICALLGDPLKEALIYGIAIFPITYYAGLFVSVLLLHYGPANKHNANDNTSGVITLLEVAQTLPENQRHKVCFVLFDQEELGLVGSGAYRRKHKKATDHQLILNLDCVGAGDHILMFPSKKLKSDRRKLTSLYKACGYFGKKSLLVHEKRYSFYPSDNKKFPYSVGICALRKGKFGLYLGRIHTKRDTVLETTNVNILRAALITFICCDAVN